MTDSDRSLQRLTDPHLPASQRRPAIKEFAQRFGWQPSDALEEYPGVEDYANGHLVVEHGLDNTAVITFLKSTYPFVVLSHEHRIKLLSISYNNLVDWHIFPDIMGMTSVLNRVDPVVPRHISAYDTPDVWRAEAFETITAHHPSPNLKNLDQALIETIAIWKRSLAAEIGSLSNDSISALFNAIFFVRALEDHKRRERPNSDRALLDNWLRVGANASTFKDCLRSTLINLGASEWPRNLLDLDLLAPFDSLDPETVAALVKDFYANRFAPYAYDFSIMSKHALSRIYEKYVSLLQEDESKQRTFIPQLPAEITDRSLGAVYTPQYIARFFSRFLADNLTPRAFRTLRTVDPACGSGIFLRTTLEMQCDPFRYETLSAESTRESFSRVFGLDWDKNACHATRLSLALLHIVLTGDFPASLEIVEGEAIEYYLEHQTELREAFGAVIANPPFIKWERMGNDLQQRVAQFLDDVSPGRPDIFLAHLKLGLEMACKGGFVLYVLPHSFLIAKNAEKLRSTISATCWVRYLVDLSKIPVFGDIGSYVILLVLEKQGEGITSPPPATIVRCREFVGHALSDAIEGRTTENDFYHVYQVEQTAFENKRWVVQTPRESALQTKLREFRPLREFLTIREGLITGADDVFIIDVEDVPSGEERLFVPFLGDREMERFHVPAKSSNLVFYPYVGKRAIDEKELSNSYPGTWEYLRKHQSKLEQRLPVMKGEFPWWRPARPRPPERLLRPKIVSPHLIVMPRFSLDSDGKYAVSRCPIMYPHASEGDEDLMTYLLAILNSPLSLWQIVHVSHRYSRGYAMLEPKTLKDLAVPSPAQVPVRIMGRIQSLVGRRLASHKDMEAEHELNELVAEIYGLTTADRSLIGMEN